VFGNLKRQWRAFRGGKPGHRFQDRYDRSKQSRESQSWAQRLIQPFAAIILLVIGVVLTFIPGPAIVFYFAGAGLLAGESRVLARGLDWSELKLRKGFHWLKRWWKQASLIAKSAVIFLGTCAVSAMLCAAYRVFLAK
jgi:hypothetical protein